MPDYNDYDSNKANSDMDDEDKLNRDDEKSVSTKSRDDVKV